MKKDLDLEQKIRNRMPVKELLRRGFYSGISWAFGATVGFVLVSTIMVFILSRAGGLPLVGSFIASVVQSTLEQLYTRTPILPN